MTLRSVFLTGLLFLFPLAWGAGVGWRWELQDVLKVADGGGRISQTGYKPSAWFRAVVPGTVLTSLVKDGVYAEPLYGENNRTIPESLCRTSYWYRADLPIPSFRPGRHIWLNFDGICYCAEVWVDGTQVGTIRGAFTRGQFDITNLVSPGQVAGLAVKITPPAHPNTPHEHTLANGTGRNGGDMGADGPAMLATVGWDWIPAIRDRDMGIWQKVTLSESGSVMIKDPHVVAELPRPKSGPAILKVKVDVSNVGDSPQVGKLEGIVEGTGLRLSVPLTLAPHEKQTVSAPELIMDHPKLWWPNGFGNQPLYKLKLRFVQREGSSASASTSFGVRKLQYFRSGEKNMTIIVNDVPIFAKGGNWGMDDAMKRIPYARLDALMRLHHDANVTMIRNWIGMSTEEDFYDLCDKYGILIWDDFWLANPVDGPNPLDDELFLANAREKIVRFRNHPSICVWCGRNEGFPPVAINDGPAVMIKDLDGQRFYQPHSSSTNGVGGGGPYAYHSPSDYFNPKDSLHTEIGAPSIPTLEAIKAMMPEKDWWPINDDWAEHDFCKGAQGGDRFPDIIGSKYGPVTGLADFVRKGHLATYESYRAMFEGREAKLWDPATGVLLWMSNPAQPSFVWQLYTYDLEQTAAFFATQKACEPVHIELDPKDGRVIVVNNLPTTFNNTLVRASVYDVGGRKLGEQTTGVAFGACASATILKISGYDASQPTFVELSLTDSTGRELSRNFYWTGSDCTGMDKMPKAPLDVTAEQERNKNGEAQFGVTLRNSTNTPAIMAHLQMRHKDGSRVLPCAYSENFVSLLPGEQRTVTVRAKLADIGADTPSFVLDGWNVLVSQTSGKGKIRVATNMAAIP